MKHIYQEKAKAESDLESFSTMFSYEDRPLYLVAVGGWEIRLEPVGIIEAIAINGRVYEPK